MITWLELKENPKFEISNKRQIRNKETNKLLKVSKMMKLDEKSYSMDKLMRLYFPENLPGEIWKDIKDYEDFFEFSNMDRFRNKKTGNIMKQTLVVDRYIFSGSYKGKIVIFSVENLKRLYFPEADLDGEIWKPAALKFTQHEVSNMCRVRNIKLNKILDGYINKQGYPEVYIPNSDGEKKSIAIHLLVAATFLENDNPKAVVNHKDGNKLNGKLDNLEYVTTRKNNQHAIDTGLLVPYKRQVYKIDPKTKVKTLYESIIDAARINKVNKNSIRNSCNDPKKKAKAGGFRWEYVTERELGSDIEDETWEQFEDTIYHVSDYGRVKNSKTKRVMKLYLLKSKRLTVSLRIKSKNIKYYVHQLVAKVFIPNIYNLTDVDHIDKNPQNNHVSNLRWTTVLNNNRHSHARSVDQYDLDGNFIKTWLCISDAQRELKCGAITPACKGKQKTCGGFIWKYTEEN